jgi:hypothetical protein
MSDYQRLSVAGSDRERALLRAGADEAPTAASVHAAARVLGILPRAAIVAYAIVAAAKTVKWSSVVTYVLAPAVAVGGLATAGYVVVSAVGAHHELPAAVVQSVPRMELAVPRPPPVVEAAPAPIAEPLPATPTVRSVPRHTIRPERAAARADGAGPASGLQQQVDLLDRARGLAASGDVAGALRALDDFDRRFGRGPMGEEAALLRIEATAARGDHAGAAALGQRFLAEHPRSVHVSRVRSIIGDGAN